MSQPGAVVRADGLTSLRIDGVRRGTLAAGIVRGPVPDPERVASKPLQPFVDHLAVPPALPLAGADIVNASDLDGQPVLVVDRAEAPTGHDEIEAYCASVSARPHWITHAAVQVERVLDQVALGTGIGWLSAWQAEPAAGRPDAVRRLQPVTLFDTYRVVWRAGDDTQTTAQFVQALVEASASLPTGREGANAGVP